MGRDPEKWRGCSAIGCDTEIKARTLYCPAHWKMLPIKIKRLIGGNQIPLVSPHEPAWETVSKILLAANLALAVKDGQMLPHPQASREYLLAIMEFGG